jgi:fatty-acyl-CoA synthase
MTPRARTLPAALGDAAATGEGFVFVDGTSERRRSYAEIHHAARRFAESLRARGLGRGDLVAVIVGDSEQFLTSLFGASMAGVVPASLSPPATMTELPEYLRATAGVLRFARAAAVVTSPSLVGSMEALRASEPALANLKVCATPDETNPDLAKVKVRATPDETSPDLANLKVRVTPDVAAVRPTSDATGAARTTSDVTGAAQSFSFALPVISLDDIAFVQFTSGSTSEPKGVVVTHRSLSANIEAINGAAGLGTSASDSAVSWLPLSHDMGLVGMALGAMYAGRPAVLMTPGTFVKRPAAWLRAISRHRATVSFAPNFGYDLCVRRVKDRDLDGLDLTCWRVAGCGGEPIHAATLAAFAAKFAAVGFCATSFLPSYGLAEHVLAATFPPRGRGVRVERLSESVDVVSCGFPLPDHRLRIVTGNGAGAAERVIGEIALAGPSVMQGYYRAGDLTAQTIREGWLHTGDLGFIDAGELFVCGRLKDVLVVNGRKYHPQDLEWAIEELAGIRRGRVVAFGIPRAGSADRVVIIVEPGGAVGADSVVAAVRQRVREVCGLYVDDVVPVPSGTIGRTTSGKVQRVATRLRYERGELQ